MNIPEGSTAVKGIVTAPAMEQGQRYNITVQRKGSGKDQTYEDVEFYGRAGDWDVFLLDGSVTLRVEDGLLVSAESV